MNEHLIDIPGRLHSVAVEKHVAGTDQIYDDFLKTTLDILNLENITDVKVQDGKLLFLNIQGLVLKEISIAFAQKQSDWNLTDSTQVDFIKGKPTVYNKLEVDDKLITKQDTISDLADIRSGSQAGATAYQKPSTGIPATDLASAVQVSLSKADTALQEHQSLAGLVNTGSYNTVSKKIELKHDNTVLAEIDATTFIKDGMVSSVTISNGYIVITFNTDAGKETIRIPVTDIFDPSNYYDKDDVDGLLADKVDKEQDKGLSTNDYTTAEKSKLNDLPTNSQLQLSLEGKANKIPMPPVVHDLIVEGTTQVSDVITLITGRFEKRPDTQIFGTFKNTSIIEFSVNYTGKLRFEGIRYSVILKYIKAYVNGTLVETSTERIIDSEILSFNVEANDIVKVEFTIYNNTDYFHGCIGDLSITSAGVPKDLIDVYNSLAPVATSGSYNDLSDTPVIPTVPTNVSAFTNDAGYLTQHQDITGKADKVSNATNGNFAALDSNGNLIDSGHKHSDYLTQHQDLSNYVQKSQTTGLLKNDGTVDTTQYLTQHQDISGKENVMPITTATGATLTAVMGNYYRLDNVGTLAITLPTITGATKLQAITFLLACGSSALVTFAPQGSETILYQEDFALEADTTYEVTALWNGSEWTLSRVIYE